MTVGFGLKLQRIRCLFCTGDNGALAANCSCSSGCMIHRFMHCGSCYFEFKITAASETMILLQYKSNKKSCHGLQAAAIKFVYRHVSDLELDRDSALSDAHCASDPSDWRPAKPRMQEKLLAADLQVGMFMSSQRMVGIPSNIK